MNDHSRSNPKHRAQGRDGEMLAPRTDTEQSAADRTAAARSTTSTPPGRIEPPVSALGPLFRHRLDRIHNCRVEFFVEISTRPTRRVLGGYYRSRGLVRIYAHDRVEGRRPLEDLFDTFLHEVAHHLEYTEPFTFGSRGCRRVPGLMHSRLFWRILGHLKWRWAEHKAANRF